MRLRERLPGAGMSELREVVTASAGAVGERCAAAWFGEANGESCCVMPTLHAPNYPIGHGPSVQRTVLEPSNAKLSFAFRPPRGGGPRAPRLRHRVALP